MKQFEVLLSQTAKRQLLSFDDKLAERIKSSLRNLANNPFKSRSGADIKKLVGSRDPELFRLRVGDYRAIYAVVEREVRITQILHRKKAYRFLE